MNQTSSSGQNNNFQNKPGIQKNIPNPFQNTLEKVLLIFLGQFLISLALGKMVYCGAEGTCDSPLGFTLVFLSIWILLDLCILLVSAFKNRISFYKKMIIALSLLMSPLLIYGSYILKEQDDKNIEKQKQEYTRNYEEGKQKEKEDAIAAAQNLYFQKKSSGIDFSAGPCLSNEVIDNWAADIVHKPRQAVDDLSENQCLSYRKGYVSHFVELDMDGNLVRTK